MLRVENGPVLNFGLDSDLGLRVSDFLSTGGDHNVLSGVRGLWSASPPHFVQFHQGGAALLDDGAACEDDQLVFGGNQLDFE